MQADDAAVVLDDALTPFHELEGEVMCPVCGTTIVRDEGADDGLVAGKTETKKPHISAAFSCLVGPHGLEPWTKGL